MNDGIEIDNSVKDIAEQPNVIESVSNQLYVRCNHFNG